MSAKPHIAILGAGPAALGAAYQLSRRGVANVSLIERNGWVGGNAASLEIAGMRVDYGSHRLHPVCDPVVLGDIRNLLKGDLLDRPRHGRIRLRGRWIHFPLKPLDLLLKLPPSFAMGVALDSLSALTRGVSGHKVQAPDEASFASVLEAGLGRTICRDFYFPYARKIWGMEPDELSGAQAHRRVSAGSLGKMLRKVASMLPGLKAPGSGRFLYPRHGYGQICDAYAAAAQASGATLHLNAGVKAVELVPGGRHVVRFEHEGNIESITADYIWSTIPITALARSLKPCPPSEYVCAAQKIDFRAMLLIYLVLEQEQFSPYDAHYFPGLDIPITRLSEPKNYSNGNGPRNVTILCAELPCSPNDPVWSQGDEELGQLVSDTLSRVGQPLRARIQRVTTRRIRNAYPMYERGYETHFNQLDGWMSELDGLLTFGRQGLFSHDNLHHALYMGYSAADCLEPNGSFNQGKWQSYRRIFETHVVED
ncbi:MAG: protoporphyrinogen/coproporphyrinogen oxidase [Chloroflexota bacterium]